MRYGLCYAVISYVLCHDVVHAMPRHHPPYHDIAHVLAVPCHADRVPRRPSHLTLAPCSPPTKDKDSHPASAPRTSAPHAAPRARHASCDAAPGRPCFGPQALTQLTPDSQSPKSQAVVLNLDISFIWAWRPQEHEPEFQNQWCSFDCELRTLIW